MDRQRDWPNKSKQFERDRINICAILRSAYHPLDYAEIATHFKYRFKYLPSIERRLRELVKLGLVAKNSGGAIPIYCLTELFDKVNIEIFKVTG